MAEGISLAKVPVFTTRGYAVAGAISLASASKRLATLERQGRVERLTRGVWIVPEHPHFSLYGCVPHLLGGELGYVSFLSAMQLHAMISQIPKAIQVATTGAPRFLVTRHGRFEFFQLHPRMVSEGVDWHDAPVPFRVASAEKALLDTLYLSTRRGRRFRRLPELELPRSFRKKELARLLRAQVPHTPVRTAVSNRLEELGLS
jgi:predicted transcriptional regulator of viral defense system